MRSYYLPLWSLAAMLASGCDDTAGNGQPTQETRTLDGFTQVANHGSLDVQVAQGPSFLVVVNADGNVVPLITTKVMNGVLIVGESESFSSKDTIRVDVTLPVFAGAENQGSGSLSVTAEPTRAITLTNSGSGILIFSGNAQAVSVDLSGSGTTTLSGSGGSLDGTLGGSGSLDASQFPVGESTFSCHGSGEASLKVTGDATLSVSGSGTIQATLNGGTVHLSVNGSGSIDWTGDSAVGSSDINGSGSITHH